MIKRLVIRSFSSVNKLSRSLSSVNKLSSVLSPYSERRLSSVAQMKEVEENVNELKVEKEERKTMEILATKYVLHQVYIFSCLLWV